jgi:hypothetical protein
MTHVVFVTRRSSADFLWQVPVGEAADFVRAWRDNTSLFSWAAERSTYPWYLELDRPVAIAAEFVVVDLRERARDGGGYPVGGLPRTVLTRRDWPPPFNTAPRNTVPRKWVLTQVDELADPNFWVLCQAADLAEGLP